MEEFLAGLGGAFLVFVTIVFLAELIHVVANKVKRHMHKRAQKNRFKKKPTAECYCVDCRFYDRDQSRCRLIGWNPAGNGFCHWADPIEYEDVKHSK